MERVFFKSQIAEMLKNIILPWTQFTSMDPLGILIFCFPPSSALLCNFILCVWRSLHWQLHTHFKGLWVAISCGQEGIRKGTTTMDVLLVLVVIEYLLWFVSVVPSVLFSKMVDNPWGQPISCYLGYSL